MIFSFPTFFKKTNDDHLPKNSLKNDISGIIENIIFILENMVFLMIE